MESDEICDHLQALGQPHRIKILKLLVPLAKHVPAEGLAAGEISTNLKLPPATLSFHLKELTRLRILTAERHGRSIVYLADLDALLRILDALVTSICSAESSLPVEHRGHEPAGGVMLE